MDAYSSKIKTLKLVINIWLFGFCHTLKNSFKYKSNIYIVLKKKKKKKKKQYMESFRIEKTNSALKK